MYLRMTIHIYNTSTPVVLLIAMMTNMDVLVTVILRKTQCNCNLRQPNSNLPLNLILLLKTKFNYFVG